jgi:hypothetical protein
MVPGYSGDKGPSSAYSLVNKKRFADSFHVFAVEWEPGVIRFLLRGRALRNQDIRRSAGRKDLGLRSSFLHYFERRGGRRLARQSGRAKL